MNATTWELSLERPPVSWRGQEAHFLAAQVQSTPKPIALHSSCFLFLQYTPPEKEKESGQHENKQET
jgi:hypothetical protein